MWSTTIIGESSLLTAAPVRSILPFVRYEPTITVNPGGVILMLSKRSNVSVIKLLLDLASFNNLALTLGYNRADIKYFRGYLKLA
jgi:hypothetical protein